MQAEDVQGETFNKHSWSDGKKALRTHTELERYSCRGQSRTVQGNVAKLRKPRGDRRIMQVSPCVVRGFKARPAGNGDQIEEWWR